MAKIKFDMTVMYKNQIKYAGEAFEFDEKDEKVLVSLGGRIEGDKQPVLPVIEEEEKPKKKKGK